MGMLLKKISIPLMVAAVLAITLNMHRFFESGEQAGQNAVKVAVLSDNLKTVESIEASRDQQIAADTRNFISKQAVENDIAREFNDYHAKVVAHHETKIAKQDPTGPDPVPACGLEDHDFGVLLAAFDSTFGERAGVSTGAGGKAALADIGGGTSGQRIAPGFADTVVAINGAYQETGKHIRQPGAGGAGSAKIADS